MLAQRAQKALVGHAQWKIIQSPSLRENERVVEGQPSAAPLLPERCPASVGRCSFDCNQQDPTDRTAYMNKTSWWAFSAFQ